MNTFEIPMIVNVEVLDPDMTWRLQALLEGEDSFYAIDDEQGYSGWNELAESSVKC
jgi:hypothetical protein